MKSSYWRKLTLCFALLLIMGMGPNDAYRSIDLDETEEQCVTGICRMHGFTAMNLDVENAMYVHLYDALIADVTVGSTTPRMTYAIPAGGGLNCNIPDGLLFNTGIAAACTTGIADAGAPGTNEMILNVYFTKGP